MSTEVILPALGESVTEGTISRWLKEVGEQVEVGEPLLEVSTDKVDTEIPSPASGVLVEIRAAEDDIAAVGSVVALIGAADQAPAAPAPAEPSMVQPEVTEPSPAAPAAVSGGTEIVLPVLGESVTEGTVSRWLKEVGEQVEVGEPLLEVSTDKVDTEIPSPASGVLVEIRAAEDEVAAVGTVVGIIGPKDALAATAQPAAPAATEQAAAAPPAPVQAVTGSAATPAPAVPGPVVAPRSAGEEGPYVTPLVRKMAADKGVDLNSITGTGVGGRIRKQDILDAAQAAAQAAAAKRAEAPTTPASAPTPSGAAAPGALAEVPAKRGTTEKLSRIRKVIAARMTESLHVSAQLTAAVEVDLTAISKLRKQVKDDFRKREGTGLTYLAFISKAVVEALKTFPELNASIDTDAGTVTYHGAEDLGIAVDTPRGLIVPVIKNAGDLNVGGLAKQIADLAARGRDNKLEPAEMTGGTFTITNYGSAGTLFDTPVINQPNVGILGTGALVKRPVVVSDALGNDVIAIRDMMFLSLTYDHRLIDGAVAARFLSAVKARLEGGDFGSEFGQ